MEATLENVQKALTTARDNAKAKRAELQEMKDSAIAEGVDFATNADAFEKYDAKGKELSAAQQEVGELEHRFASILEAEGMLSRKDDGSVVETRKGEVEVRGAQDVGMKAAGRIHETMGEDIRAAFAKGITYGDPVPKVNVEVLTRAETEYLLKAAGDNVLTGASSTSAGAFVVNERLGLYVDIPFRPFTVLDVVGTSTTDSDTVEYVEQTAKTNAAAATAEATSGSTGALPESAMTLAVRTVGVENIGHYIPATSRALADAGQLRGLLNDFLVEGVKEELEDQVIGGDGNSPNLAGIATAVSQAIALGTDTRADAVHKAITTIRTASTVKGRVEPTAIMLSAEDYQDLRLEKDANGNYLFGGPTAAPTFPIWGLRPVVNLGANNGTPTVGDFAKSCTLWIREGISVAVSDSNSDWFIRNILTIKAQVRAAFKVTRPGAFCEITGF